eukprot:g6893.t1
MVTKTYSARQNVTHSETLLEAVGKETPMSAAFGGPGGKVRKGKPGFIAKATATGTAVDQQEVSRGHSTGGEEDASWADNSESNARLPPAARSHPDDWTLFDEEQRLLQLKNHPINKQPPDPFANESFSHNATSCTTTYDRYFRPVPGDPRAKTLPNFAGKKGKPLSLAGVEDLLQNRRPNAFQRTDLNDPGEKYREKHGIVSDAGSVMNLFLGSMRDTRRTGDHGPTQENLQVQSGIGKAGGSPFSSAKKRNKLRKQKSKEKWRERECDGGFSEQAILEKSCAYSREIQIAGISKYHIDRKGRVEAYLAAASTPNTMAVRKKQAANTSASDGEHSRSTAVPASPASTAGLSGSSATMPRPLNLHPQFATPEMAATASQMTAPNVRAAAATTSYSKKALMKEAARRREARTKWHGGALKSFDADKDDPRELLYALHPAQTPVFNLPLPEARRGGEKKDHTKGAHQLPSKNRKNLQVGGGEDNKGSDNKKAGGGAVVEDAGKTAATDEAATRAYARLCYVSGLVPQQKHVVGSDVRKFSARSDHLQDQDLKALTVLLQKRPLTLLDLTDNPSISDESFVPLLKSFCPESSGGGKKSGGGNGGTSDAMSCVASTLRTLTLDHCFGLGNRSTDLLAEKLPKFFNLKHLSLAGLKALSPQTLLQTSSVVGEKPMVSLNFSDVRMPTDLAPKIADNLLENIRLQSLDLSWNNFDGNFYKTLRAKLQDHAALRRLHLQNTALKEKNQPHPLHVFLEGLRDYANLELDLSLNHLSAKSCCILEASLHYNLGLQELIMEGNPIGAEGCRCLLRSLVSGKGFPRSGAASSSGGCTVNLNKLRTVRLKGFATASQVAAEPESTGAGGVHMPVGPDQGERPNTAASLSGGGQTADPSQLDANGNPVRPRTADKFKIQRRAIDPTDASSGAADLGYSLWNFVGSAAQRVYVLNLNDPGERAILYLLLFLRDKLPACAFADHPMSPTPVLSCCAREEVVVAGAGGLRERWVIRLPESSGGAGQHPRRLGGGNGALTNPAWVKFTFQLVVPVAELMLSKAPPTDHQNRGEPESVTVLRRAREVCRVVPSLDEELKLAALWRSFQRDGNPPKDQHAFLQALSLDFSLSLTFVHMLITYAPLLKHKILFHLVNAIAGTGGASERCQLLIARHCVKRSDSLKVNMYARKFLQFLPENPNGFYSLELESCCDYAVAEGLLHLDRWEQGLLELAKEKSSNNTFAPKVHGNPSNFRNEKINGTPFEMSAAFQLPLRARLECDFASTRRPPKNAVPMQDEDLKQLENPSVIWETVLHSFSDRVFLTCRQFRRLLQLFLAHPKLGLDLVVAFCTRCVDWYLNEKIVRSAVSREEWNKGLKMRLGSIFYPQHQKNMHLCCAADKMKALGRSPIDP